MATSAAFFSALAARVEGLGRKARGMRLAAEDWNGLVGTMVEALLNIGRAQDEAKAGLDAAYAPIHHEHLGEVTHAWLAPDLLKEIAQGGGSQQILDTLASLQKQINETKRLSESADATSKSLAAQVAAHATQIAQIRNLLRVLDERRGPDLTQMTIRMDAIAVDHSKFRRDYGALKTELATLAKGSGQFMDEGGAPIDLAALAQQVNDLDALRDHLTGDDGKPIRSRDLQVQLGELAGRAATDEEIETRFGGIKAELDRVSADVEGRLETLRGELGTASSEALAGLRSRLDQVAADNQSAIATTADRLRETETRLATSFTSEIGATRTTLMATLRQQAGEAVNQRLSGVDARIEGLITTRTTELKTKLTEEIGKPLDTRLTQSLAEATGRLDTKFAGIEARVGAATEAIPRELTKGLASVETGLQTRVDSRFAAKATELSQALAGQVEQKVTAGINAGLIEVRAAASQTVTDRLANLDARIVASVTSATRDLPDRIAATVDTRLQQVNIPGQIAAASRQLDTELRREIATSAANLQSINTTALNSAMTNLRADFAVRSSTDPRATDQRTIDLKTTDLRTTDLRTTDLRGQTDLRGRTGPGG
jgi:hypothetical protein